MATVVNIESNPTFENVGTAIGKGFSKGMEYALTKKEATDKARRFGALMEAVHAAGSKQKALQLANDPQFSDLFKSMEEVQGFGKLVDDAYKGENPKQFDAMVGGQRRTVFLTDEQSRKVAAAPNQDEAFAEILGMDPKNTHLGFDEKQDDKDIVDLLNDQGQVVKSLSKDEFNKDPIKAKAGGLKTADEFDRGLKLTQEERAKKAADQAQANSDRDYKLRQEELARKKAADKAKAEGKGGEGDKPTDAQRRAMGILDSRGIPQTPDSVNKAMAVTDRADQFAGRIAATFNMASTNQGFVEKLEGSGDSARFSAAQAAMPDLMFAGLTDTQAYKASVTIGNAIPTKGVDINNPINDLGQPNIVDKPPKVQIQELTSENGATLTDKDRGTVFKKGDAFAVFVGIKDGKPQFELVQP